jgi:uncharacterized protein YpmB
MMRGNFIGKWILGSTICLLIVAGACYLWYNHSIAPYEKEAAETAKAVSEWKKSQKVNTYNVTEEVTTTPAKSTPATAEKPKTETIDVPDNVSGNAKTNDVEAGTSPAETAENVPVSPNGFGPYPELPEGWSPKTWNNKSANIELIKRVLIKLWNQGEIRTKGGAMENGLVYPIVPGTLYVEWDTYTGPLGKSVRYISNSLGHPDDHPRLEAISEAKRARRARPRSLTEEDIPSDIKLVPISEGIDPYTFLDLP